MPKAASWWIQSRQYSPRNLWDQHLGAKPLRKSLESDLGKTHGCMECPVFGECGKVVRSSKCPAGGIQGQPDHGQHVRWNNKLWTNLDMHRLYRWVLSEKATRNIKEWDLSATVELSFSTHPYIILDPMSWVPLPCRFYKPNPTPLTTWRPSSLRLCELETFQKKRCVNQLKRFCLFILYLYWMKETDFGPMILSKEIYLDKIIVMLRQKATSQPPQKAILSINTNTCTSLNSISRTFWTFLEFKLPALIPGNWRKSTNSISISEL